MLSMIVMNILERTLKHRFFIQSFYPKNVLQKQQTYFLFNKSFTAHQWPNFQPIISVIGVTFTVLGVTLIS